MIKQTLEKCLREHLTFPESKNLQQRGIADKIEDACNVIIGTNFKDVKPASSRRSIEDVNIGNIYVDHKTSDAA